MFREKVPFEFSSLIRAPPKSLSKGACRYALPSMMRTLSIVSKKKMF